MSMAVFVSVPVTVCNSNVLIVGPACRLFFCSDDLCDIAELQSRFVFCSFAWRVIGNGDACWLRL